MLFEPDLVIESIKWTNVSGSLYNNDPIRKSKGTPYIYFSIVVKNKGTTAAILSSKHVFGIYKYFVADSNLIMQAMLTSPSAILPGERYAMELNYFYIPSTNDLRDIEGSFSMIGRIDDTNVISEENEMNNNSFFVLTFVP